MPWQRARRRACACCEYARSMEGRPLVLLIVGSPANIATVGRHPGPSCTARRPPLPHADAGRGVDPGPARDRVDPVLGSRRRGVGRRRRPRARIPPGGGQRPGDRGDPRRRHRGDRPDGEPGRSGALRRLDPARREEPAPTRSRRAPSTFRAGRAAAVSHELFDLNRDWFVLTHPETVGRVNAMLRYHPTVVADLHEMGAEEGYFFAPPAEPRHPLLVRRGGRAARAARARQRRGVRRAAASATGPGRSSTSSTRVTASPGPR